MKKTFTMTRCPLMMSQKEAPRKHPCVLPRKVYLVWIPSHKKIMMGASWVLPFVTSSTGHSVYNWDLAIFTNYFYFSAIQREWRSSALCHILPSLRMALCRHFGPKNWRVNGDLAKTRRCNFLWSGNFHLFSDQK